MSSGRGENRGDPPPCGMWAQPGEITQHAESPGKKRLNTGKFKGNQGTMMMC